MSTLFTRRLEQLSPTGKSQSGEVEATTGQSLDGDVTPFNNTVPTAGLPDSTAAAGTALYAGNTERDVELARAIEFLVLMGASSLGTTTVRELRRSGRRQIAKLKRARLGAIHENAARRQFRTEQIGNAKRRPAAAAAVQRGRDRSAPVGPIPLAETASHYGASIGPPAMRSPAVRV